jgi:hypothetical protein
MSTPSPFITRREVATLCGMSHSDATLLFKKHKLTPKHREKYGAGFMELYDRAEVQPLVDAHLARVGAKNKVPSAPAVSSGLEAKITGLGMTMQSQYGQIVHHLREQSDRATAQNAVLLKAIEKQTERINVLMTQLGVKE